LIKILLPQKVLWIIMQDSLVKYYPKGGDFIRDHRLDLAMMQTQEVPLQPNCYQSPERRWRSI